MRSARCVATAVIAIVLHSRTLIGQWEFLRGHPGPISSAVVITPNR